MGYDYEGKVQQLLITREFGWIILKPTDPDLLDVKLLLWDWRTPPTGTLRLSQSIWLTVILNSITNDKIIRVGVDSIWSAIIEFVTLVNF